LTQAGHRVVVNDGNWYNDDDHDDNVYDDNDHVGDLRKGDGKTEPAAAAKAAKAAEAAAVATAKADNNQQRAAKTAATAIAVGKRRQARGEKRGRRRRGGRRRWRPRLQRWQQWPVRRWGEARGESGDWSSTYTLGDNLAHIKAMRLANAYLEVSKCLASRQAFICAADRFICSRR
jgi:hypothetical protein